MTAGVEGKATIVVYEDEGSRWRWRMRLNNSKTFAASGESFAKKGNATRAAQRMARLLRGYCQATVFVDHGDGKTGKLL